VIDPACSAGASGVVTAAMIGVTGAMTGRMTGVTGAMTGRMIGVTGVADPGCCADSSQEAVHANAVPRQPRTARAA
jgi:hypothetical protein